MPLLRPPPPLLQHAASDVSTSALLASVSVSALLCLDIARFYFFLGCAMKNLITCSPQVNPLGGWHFSASNTVPVAAVLPG